MTEEERKAAEAEKKRQEEEAAAKKRESDETVVVKLDELKAVVKETVEQTVTERLKAAGVGNVDRGKVAARPDGGEGPEEIPAWRAGRAAPRFEAQMYRDIPENIREFRTPDLDHHIQQWAIGVMRNDHQAMAEAHEAIRGITGEARDLNLTSDTQLVPSPLASTIVELKRKIQMIGPRATHFTTEATTLEIPTEATFAAASGVAEGGIITPSDPTWGTVTLTKVKSVVSTKSSVEFIEDNAFNAVSFLGAQAAKTIALRNDAQDMADGDGTGTNQSDALEQASINEVDGSVGTMLYADVLALWYTLLSQYRGNSVWLGGNGIMKEFADLVDGNSRPIFTPGGIATEFQPISGGQGAPGVGTIFGRPVLEIAGATAGVLILGDLSYYGVLDHGSIRAEFSRETAFLTDEVVWKWVQRRDGAVLQVEAFQKHGGITEA